VPRGIETHHLTLSTLLWSALIVVFSYMTRWNIHFLWGVSLMIVAQYITDMLDGAVGRARDTGLVKWGFYMDHFLDYIFLCAILIGYRLMANDHHKYPLFYVLALFGAYMVNSFLSFAADGKFKISYLGVGPTEVRLFFILVNTFIILLHNRYEAVWFLPVVLTIATLGLIGNICWTQKQLWEADMEAKRRAEQGPWRR
jgi:phosphatidylglycerophosphate synthase